MPLRQLVESDSWLEHVGDSFMRAMLNEDLEPKTVRSYMVGIKNLFAFLRENGVDDFHYVRREHLQRWQDALRERRDPPLKAATRSTYSTAVRRLLKFAAESDIVDYRLQLAIKGVRTRRDGPHEREPIPEEDLLRLVAYFNERPRMTVIDKRDRALFFFLLYTGLRITEALQVTRFNYMKGRVRGKGKTWVDFHSSPTVARYIESYLEARRDDEAELWIRHGNNINVGGVLADSGVREIWRRICAELRIERFVTHQTRHTAGTRVYEETGDTRAVMDWLHHRDERTAHRYVKTSERHKRDTAEKMEGYIANVVARAALLHQRMPPGGRPRYRRTA